MSLISLSLDSLVCQSLLEAPAYAGAHTRDISSLFGSEPLYLFQPRDVLYIPLLGLQVVGQRLVPQEAIAEPWTLKFEQERKFQGRSDDYIGPLHVDAVDRDVCILSNFYSRNFFHWLTEEMMKVVMLERAGFNGSYVAPGLPAFALEFLRLLEVEANRVITEVGGPTVYRSATYLTSIHGGNLFRYRNVLDALRETLLKRAGARPAATARRIWVERKTGVNNPGRDLANPGEVHEVLKRYEVETVDFAAFSVADQIRLAADCDLLTGIHGAGFVHAMFMRLRSTIIECYSPLFINPGIFEICRVLHHRHHMLVYEHAYGGYPYGKQVKVNAVQLELALSGLKH